MSSHCAPTHTTSKSPSPSTQPLKIILPPPSHKQKGHSTSAGPSHTKVPHEIFDGVVVPTPTWLVKAHPWTPSYSPSEAVTLGTTPTCSRCMDFSSRVDSLESEIEGLKQELEVSKQQHKAQDYEVDTLHKLVEHLWAHIFQTPAPPSPWTVPVLINFDSEDNPMPLNPPARTPLEK
ncbi:hypothetical protein J3A83DRAFT_4373238 [Scleroderma citrinum]